MSTANFENSLYVEYEYNEYGIMIGADYSIPNPNETVYITQVFVSQLRALPDAERIDDTTIRCGQYTLKLERKDSRYQCWHCKVVNDGAG